MNNFETDILRNIAIAPYLQFATALIGKSRRIGGNQFRHVWATAGILIDHKIIDPVILKAAVLHDIKEDAPDQFFPDEIKKIDDDGSKVVELVNELSINKNVETKNEYLCRIMNRGSAEAKLIKLADRISNLTDIQLGTFDVEHIKKTLNETITYILPKAKDVNENMYNEILDLINKRKIYVEKTVKHITAKTLEHITSMIENVTDDTVYELSIVKDNFSTKDILINTLYLLKDQIQSDAFTNKISNEIFHD